MIHLYSLVLLVFALAAAPIAHAQNDLDLGEADARDAAYEFIDDAEERFDCDLEEHNMWAVGNSASGPYVFQVTTEGEECDPALTWLVTMADREGKLIFRKLETIDQPPDHQFIAPDQVLIHEVDPEVGDDESGSDAESPPNPQSG